jgi:hypothetical protein
VPAFVMDVTHIDTSSKAARVELVQTILQELKEHEQTQFNFLFTGDDL